MFRNTLYGEILYKYIKLNLKCLEMKNNDCHMVLERCRPPTNLSLVVSAEGGLVGVGDHTFLRVISAHLLSFSLVYLSPSLSGVKYQYPTVGLTGSHYRMGNGHVSVFGHQLAVFLLTVVGSQ